MIPYEFPMISYNTTQYPKILPNSPMNPYHTPIIFNNFPAISYNTHQFTMISYNIQQFPYNIVKFTYELLSYPEYYC